VRSHSFSKTALSSQKSTEADNVNVRGWARTR
jgi:hypothetical protein